MGSSPLRIPDLVRQKALQRGDAGRRWLRELPELVAAIESDWDLRVGRGLDGASESFVAEAMLDDGTEAVVRLQLPPEPTLDPDASFETSVWVHTAARGDAYARLFRSDLGRRALLLERLGRPLADSGLPRAAQLETLCELLGRAWRIEPDISLEHGDRKARRLASFVLATWEDTARPCPEGVIALAVRFADARAAAFDPVSAVVVHGDPHPRNALRSRAPEDREPAFKLVDPESFLAEPAYDLGVCMRDWSSELLAGDVERDTRDLCGTLARASGVPPRPIWEWGFLERVSTGLFLLQLGAENDGRRMLAVAERLAASPDH